VELTVLGASGSWPDLGTALSGYLVQHEGFNLWVDAGSGTMANLQRYIKIADIHAMILTHEHADHCVDVYPLFYARYYARQGSDHLPLYIPRGFGSRIHALLSEESVEGFHIGFDVHEVGPDESFEVGPLQVGTRGMSHLGLPALGFRLEANGSALAYTGDTGPSPEVVELARGADVFLAEATYQDQDQLQPFHLSARQAAQHAREAGVGRLVLTHILPSHDKVRSREQAREEFEGPVEAADEGMTFEVGR
jgi:ribonuclease BN (tRNA processing enzyme)